MPEEKESAPPPFDLNKFLQTILAQNAGDKDATIRQLGIENLRSRAKYRKVRARADELEKNLPQKDAKVLVGEEAKNYDLIQELKLTPKDIKDGLAERDTLKSQLAGLRFESDVSKAANAFDVKYKPGILLDQLNSRGMEVAFRKAKVKDDAGNEDEVELPHVRKKGEDKAPWTVLNEYVDKDLKDYKPALEVSAETNGEGDANRRFTPVPGGTPAAPGKARGKRDLAADYLASRYVLPGEESSKTPTAPTTSPK